MMMPPPFDDGHHEADLSVGDPVVGKTRLLSEQCRTCIFRLGNLMSLAPGALRDMVDKTLTAGSYIICHETLPYADPPPGVAPAICRGFHDRYDTTSLQVIRRLWGFVEADPPSGRLDTPPSPSTPQANGERAATPASDPATAPEPEQ